MKKLGEVFIAEYVSISLLFPLLFYYKNNKKNKLVPLVWLIPGIRVDRSYSSF